VDALRHPYVAQFADEASEPSCSHAITIPINDNHKYSIAEYRDKLYNEILKRKRELLRKAREREARASGGGGGGSGGNAGRLTHGSSGSAQGQCGGKAAVAASGGARRSSHSSRR
jgi:mitogen-activated protein kinase 15